MYVCVYIYIYIYIYIIYKIISYVFCCHLYRVTEDINHFHSFLFTCQYKQFQLWSTVTTKACVALCGRFQESVGKQIRSERFKLSCFGHTSHGAPFYLEYSHMKKFAFDHLSYICALPAVVHKSQVKRKSHGFIKQPINRHFRL